MTLSDGRDITTSMIIIGIDPGVARIGWAIVNIVQRNVSANAYGCIITDKSNPIEKRLLHIHVAVSDLINKYHPEFMSVEELFFQKNAKTAITVGEARGVIMLAAAQTKIPLASYGPMVVKQAICGSGSAEKSQIQRMTAKLLKLPTIPKPDDTADALAIALTHAYSYRVKYTKT